MVLKLFFKEKLYMNKNNLLIVVVGMCGSGKSTIASYFKKKGWNIIRFGEITIEELKRRNLEDTEQNERIIREELRKNHGQEAYAKLLLPKIKESIFKGNTLIDGLYSWAEYLFLKKNLPINMSVVNVFTDRLLRYKRLSVRKERPLSFEEAQSRDYAEIEKLDKGGPIAMADYTIINNVSPKKFYHELDKLIFKISSEKNEITNF